MLRLTALLALAGALALAGCNKPTQQTAEKQGTLTATVTETVTTTKTVDCATVTKDATKSPPVYTCTPFGEPPPDCTANPSAPGCTPPTNVVGADGIDWSLPAITCPSGSMVITGKWGNSTIYTSEGPNAPFNQQWLAIEVKPPAGWTGNGSVKTSSWVEYIDGGSVRSAQFSSQPCTLDERYAAKLKGGTGGKATSKDQIGFAFKYTTAPSEQYAVTLIPGKTYWINAKNFWQIDGSASCTGSCNMRGGLPQ